MWEKRDAPGTAFNMGLATLERMDRLLNICILKSIEGDLYNWYNTLLGLRREISCFIEETELNDLENLFKSIPEGSWKMSGKNIIAHQQHQGNLIGILDKIDMKIKSLMKSKGLLMPKSDDPRFSWAMEAG